MESCLTLADLLALGDGGSLNLLGALGDEHGVDVGENTTLGDGDTAQKLVELLIVSHSQLDMARDDARLLVVAGSVTSELKNLSSEVLEDGGKVHGGTGSDTGSVAALLQEASDTSNGELKTSLGTAGGRFLGS